MGVVLVVEPEAAQAEQLLKVLRKRVRAESILVSSTAAAIEAIGHGTPDLILLSTLLSPRDEDSLMAHLRSLEGAAHLQTLTIPQLAFSSKNAEEKTVFGRFRKKKAAPAQTAGCDPKAFAEEIAAHLARAVEIRSQPRTEPMFKPAAVEPPVEPAFEAIAAPAFEEAAEPVFEPVAESAPVESFDSVFEPMDTPAAAAGEPMFSSAEPMFSSTEPMFSSTEPMFSPRAPMFSSGAVEASDDPDLTSAILASLDADDAMAAIPEAAPEPVFSPLLLEEPIEEPLEAAEPVSTSALFEPDDEIDLSSALLAAHAEQAPAPVPPAASAANGRPAAREAAHAAKEIDFSSALFEAHGEPVFSSAMFESHAEPDFDFALIESALSQSALVESKPQTKKPAANQKPAVAESNVVAFRPAAPVVPVSEPKVEAAVEPAKEAEPDDLLERLARRFGFGSEMFKVAEADAPSALPSGKAGARRQDPVAEAPRAVEVKSEPVPEPETEPEPVVQDDSEDRMAAQVAAVQAEAEATLAAELERVRAEGETRRLAELARLQADADTARDAAIAEARSAAEREARDALDAELTRVRSEAEGVRAADLARVRAEVEEKLKTQVGEAETRLAEAERARSAAEAAAAAALGAEVARVRGEAETRLQSELERIRREAEAARAAEQSVAKHATEQIREAAAREAREVAEQAARRTLDTEIARVRVQADTFLETEVSRVRSEAQDRQAAELQDLRAQMAEIRETAARTAAEKSGDYYKIWQPRLVPVEKPQPVVEVPEPATPVSFETYKPWLKWALPMAASVLLIANSGMVINTFASFVAPSPKKEPPPVHAVEPVEPPIVEKVGGALKIDSTPVGAEALIDGRSYGKTPLTIPDLRPGVHTLVLRTGAGSVTRRVTIKAGQTAISSEAIFAGWLAIFSPIPVEVSLNGRRAPVAENGRIMTAPGTYRVDLVNARFNYHVTETLDVRPGEVTAHTVSIPTAAVHVTAPDGADISVDGQPAGKAPLADLTIPIGTHAITATHPDRGARTTTLAVRFDEINNARLEFDR